MESAFKLLGILAFFQAARHILVLHNLLRLRLQRPTCTVVGAGEVPPHTLAGLQPALDELTALGFVLQGWTRGTRISRHQDDATCTAWMLRAEDSSWASVVFTEVPETLHLASTTFHTFPELGPPVVTVNGAAHGVAGEYPAVLGDASAASLAEHWAFHQSQLKGRGPALPLDLEGVLARSNAMTAQYFESLTSQARVTPAEDGAFMLTWREAARMTHKLMAGTAAWQKVLVARAQALQRARVVPPVPPLEEEVAAYRRHEELRNRPARRNFQLWLLVATLAIFLLSPTHLADPVSAAILVAVILFHELGHLAAMKAFGASDATIFFIPFLGAATTGRRPRATHAQDLVILLAGPVPGLVLAYLLSSLAWAQAPWMHQLVMMLAAVNLLNLLPVLPLDGGRVVHGLLFERFAISDVVFRVLAALVLVASWGLGEHFLPILGVFMLLGIPSAYRTAEVRRRFRRARQASPEVDDVTLLLRVVREAGQERLPMAQKLQLCTTVLTQGSRQGPPGFLGMAGGLAVYVAALGLGVFSLATAAVGPPTRASVVEREPALLATVALPCASEPRLLNVTQARQLPPEKGFPKAVVQYALFPSDADATRAAASLGGDAWGRLVTVGADITADEDDESAWEAARLAASVQAGDAVKRAGGTPLMDARSANTDVLLKCTAASPDAAAVLEETLHSYFALPVFLNARPPWVLPDDDTRAGNEPRARAAYVHAENAKRASLRGAVGGLGLLRALYGQWMGGGNGARDHALARARQAILEDLESRPASDVETQVVQAVIDQMEPGRDAATARRQKQRLGTLLGSLDPPDAPDTAMPAMSLGGRVVREGNTLSIRAWGLPGPSSRRAASALVDYLCLAACQDPRLTVSSLHAPSNDGP